MNQGTVPTSRDEWLQVNRNTDVSYMIATSLTFVP